MKVSTDDELYRVDAVWLGPPEATFPWRWRYVDYAIFLTCFLGFLALLRAFGFTPSIWLFVWTAVAAAFVVQFGARKIGHERPLGAVLVMAGREISSPRPKTTPIRGTVSLSSVRVTRTLPSQREENHA